MDHVASRTSRLATLSLGLLISSSFWSSSAVRAQESPKARVAAAGREGAETAIDRVADSSTAARDRASKKVLEESDPIARARKLIAGCQAKYQTVQDYTCTFYKQERIDGQLYTPHIMSMKARTKPASLYFKFVQPNTGREAIFVHGRDSGKIIAHDVGLGRVVAGTMHLDPKGDMAMEENRHPVTEAGLGSMINLVQGRWNSELHEGESIVLFHNQARVGDRPCVMVETIHPRKGPEYLFHKVKLYVDQELNLPIRFEAYDWPASAKAEPELMEEYTYMNLKLNVGLKEKDFDPKNAQYSYGRF